MIDHYPLAVGQATENLDSVSVALSRFDQPQASSSGLVDYEYADELAAFDKHASLDCDRLSLTDRKARLAIRSRSKARGMRQIYLDCTTAARRGPRRNVFPRCAGSLGVA